MISLDEQGHPAPRTGRAAVRCGDAAPRRFHGPCPPPSAGDAAGDLESRASLQIAPNSVTVQNMRPILLPVASEDRDISVEIRLPFLTIGTTSIQSLFRRRDRRTAGPFLIISVTSGLALDTALGTAQGTSPHLWGPHGKPHQLWYLRPSGHAGEVHIVSAANGLVLDAGRGMGDGYQPQMWAQSDAAWKRWRLAPSPDGRAHTLSCEGTGTVLDSPWDAKWETRPVMWNGHGGENQQWVLALPFGTSPIAP